MVHVVPWDGGGKTVTRKLAQPEATGYERHKDRARERQAAQSRSGRDIGEIPPVGDPERRAAAEASFRVFCEIYFGEIFYLNWSADHLKVIARIEECVRHGGQFALAMPRGNGKTNLCECAAIWAILCGHRSFVALIGASASHANEMLESIKVSLETNELLGEDYPEVCYPIEKLEGISNRARGQTCQGEQTRITWTRNVIVLPTIKGSKASGAIIKVAGITGRVRGMKHKTADGKAVRPDLVIVDDPQTDESARSKTQCQAREEVLTKAILGLAGPDQTIACVMPCTVIEPGDVADHLLDRDRHPEWMGERMRLVVSWPEREDLWQEYAELRADDLRAGDRTCRNATEFYRKNRAEMDRGGEVTWPDRYQEGELSAIQYAWNKRLLHGDAAFMAEFQNGPEVDPGEIEELTAEQIADKVNRIPRSTVPLETTKLTAFIDVQGGLLYWLVAGWSDDFTGYVVDYGAYPDQRRHYFTLRNANPTLSDLHPGGLEASIYGGLQVVTEEILGKPWRREGDTEQRVEKCLIDANWGDLTDTVYQFCRQSRHAALLLPSHGKGIGPKQKPMSEWKPNEGEKIGFNWRLSAPRASKRAIRHVLIDTNFWKSFIHTRFTVPMGGRGCLSLFGTRPADHRLFSEHLTVETRVRSGGQGGQGRKVDEWVIPSNKPDNHWFDCMVGAAVAASILGCKLDAGALAGAPPPPERPKRQTLGQRMAARQGVRRL